MKAIKIITHPVLLILSFLFVLISGQHLGGFYLLYLLLALPHGGIHSLIAVAGILLLVLTYIKFRRENKFIIEAILNIVGSGFLVLSLVLFFYRDQQGNNSATFEQLVPQITLILFGVLTFAFIINNIVRSFSRKPVNGNLSMS